MSSKIVTKIIKQQFYHRQFISGTNNQTTDQFIIIPGGFPGKPVLRHQFHLHPSQEAHCQHHPPPQKSCCSRIVDQTWIDKVNYISTSGCAPSI